MSRGLPARMLIGLVAGLALGITAHAFFGGQPVLEGLVRYVTEPVGRIFLRLLFVLVVPLIVSALALGVAGLGDLRRLGRIGLKTLAYTVVVSSIAVLIGVDAGRTCSVPGRGCRRSCASGWRARRRPPRRRPRAPPGVDFLVNLVPNNPIKAMADGDMLAVMVFALFLGIGLAVTRTEAARRFEEALQGLYDVVMRLLGMVIRLAPIGVACLLFTLTARLGFDMLRQLGAYVLVVVRGARHPAVRRLLALGPLARRHEPDHVLPRDPRRHGHGVLDRLEQRDAADLAAGRRGAARAAAAREPLRAHASARRRTRTAPRCSRA